METWKVNFRFFAVILASERRNGISTVSKNETSELFVRKRNLHSEIFSKSQSLDFASLLFGVSTVYIYTHTQYFVCVCGGQLVKRAKAASRKLVVAKIQFLSVAKQRNDAQNITSHAVSKNRAAQRPLRQNQTDIECY